MVIAQLSDTGTPVEGVAIVLRLFARSKNDYYVGPKITDVNGQASFSREECVRAIQRAQQMFIMDYVGTLETCRPVLEARLHPSPQIAKMLELYKSYPEFWGQAFDDPASLFGTLATVRNGEFEEAQVSGNETQILEVPELVLRLKRINQSKLSIR